MSNDKLRDAILHVKMRIEGGDDVNIEELVSETIKAFGLNPKDGLALEKAVNRNKPHFPAR